MKPNEMQSLLRQQPFQPIRIYLDDGRSFEIHHPQLNLVTDLRLVVGIPAPNDPDPTIADHFVRIAWSAISRWEFVTSDTPA